MRDTPGGSTGGQHSRTTQDPVAQGTPAQDATTRTRRSAGGRKRGRGAGRTKAGAGADGGRGAGGPARARTERADLYAEVTNRIVAELEAGRFPWVQPWRGTGDRAAGTAATGLPRNAATGRAYSGINVLILWGAVIEYGYPTQGWLTFRQALDAGGSVRKGEHGVTVVYADRFVPRDSGQGGAGQAAAGQGRADPGPVRGAGSTGRGEGAGAPDGDPRAIPFLKRFTVFNVAQCDGLRPDLAADPVPLPPREIVPVAERVIAASGVDFRIGGDRAFYAPGPDLVVVPPQPAFFDQINYYRTCLHELTHATGHASRLSRQLLNGFGTKDYAREELVAELGSAFLCAALGIVPTVRHADYLACWLDLLREDKRAIFKAASAASRAAEWLLARDRDHAASGAATIDPATDPARAALGQGPDAGAAHQLPSLQQP